jgi:hypothetical protein
MVPIYIADHEESCADDQAKDAARRTIEESRETRPIEGLFGPAHGKPPLERDKRMGNSVFARHGIAGFKLRIVPSPYKI